MVLMFKKHIRDNLIIAFKKMEKVNVNIRKKRKRFVKDVKELVTTFSLSLLIKLLLINLYYLRLKSFVLLNIKMILRRISVLKRGVK